MLVFGHKGDDALQFALGQLFGKLLVFILSLRRSSRLSFGKIKKVELYMDEAVFPALSLGLACREP